MNIDYIFTALARLFLKEHPREHNGEEKAFLLVTTVIERGVHRLEPDG